MLLINKSDTTQIKGTTANDNGVFNFINLVKSTYILRVEYAAYKTYNQDLLLTENTYNVGVISMVPSTLILETAIIKGRQELVKQKGDTTEYSAGAYKTNPDAYAQDLISKMPGVTNENGTLKAQGEIINKVTVDGKEFFGEDASIALKNLPAEIVDKIQVFDKPSDQSQFTGFDDGNSSRTINIITKGGKTNGTFGRIFG